MGWNGDCSPSLSKITKNLLRLNMNKIRIKYYIGMALTCLLAIGMIPIFFVVLAVVRTGVLVFDALSLPYNAMTQYQQGCFRNIINEEKEYQDISKN